MYELIIVMTYLARCWQMMDRIDRARVAMPGNCLDEFRRLNAELTGFFIDPPRALGHLIEEAMRAEAASDPDPPAEDPPPAMVPCPACDGKGDIPSRFIGVRPIRCDVCGGTGQIAELVLPQAVAT